MRRVEPRNSARRPKIMANIKFRIDRHLTPPVNHENKYEKWQGYLRLLHK